MRFLGFEKRAGDNPWLDLVRSLAIALVVLRHGQRAISPPTESASGILHHLAANGWVGVDLFFVLSGYLISTHLVRHGLMTGRFAWSHYITMRALRIVPSYVAVLALIVSSAFPLYGVQQENLALRVGYHLLFLQDYLPSDINVVFWSLGVEEKFYLLAPLLLWLALSRSGLARSIGIIGAVFMLSPALRTVQYYVHDPFEYVRFFELLRSPFHMALEPLMIGVAIAVVQHAGIIRLSRRHAVLLLGGSIAALLAWLATHDMMATIGLFDVVLQPALIAGLCGLAILGAVQANSVAMPCEAPVRAVARLSYCLYLVHFPLLPLMLAVAASTDHSVAMFWMVYLASSFVAAGLLHVGVEQPFLNLKDHLARQWPPAPLPSKS